MLDQHKPGDHVWQTSLLLVVRKTQMLYCYHICLLRQTLNPQQMSRPGLCAVFCCL